MGLFKKFFSIGSKRFKKRSAVDPCTQSPPPVKEHLKPSHIDDTEAAVSRLLRSSSGRCAVEPQIGIGSLPALRKFSVAVRLFLIQHIAISSHPAHPIDSVIPPPKSSSTTLASISARSTYSVTIHGRTVHSRTEFPNAYPPMDMILTPKRSFIDSPRRRSKSVPITPRDKNRLLALRQDPSVASLLNHYDDEGHLDSTLFSNTPSPRKEGCVQRRRTGSTLRQLLGHPSFSELRNSNGEGDISWAERFLGLAPNAFCYHSDADMSLSETDCSSSVSSIGPRTPADTHFTHIHSIDDETALSIECDTSPADQSTFSSLEVELSVSTDLAHPQTLNSPYDSSMSPQRASQIFGFLGDKKRAQDSPASRLPQLKSTTTHYRRFSAEPSIGDTKLSHIPLSHRCATHIPQPTSPISQRRYSSPPSPPTTAVFLSPQLEDEESTHLQPVIIQHGGYSNRNPRGPCPPTKIPSRQSTSPLSVPCELNDSYLETEQPLPTQSVLGEMSNTNTKSISVAAARPREMYSQIPKLRSASGSSSSSAESKHDPISSPRRHPLCLQPGVQIKPKAMTELPTGIAPHGKENDALSRLPQPVTPVRPFGLHAHHLRELPSPASSSELSPVAKQMMANLRQQRMDARQRERQTGRLGSSQSRIRY